MSRPLYSYAQNAEDMVLWRALRHRPTGFFVDVGAHHPVGGSVTRVFTDHGWRGINIEPIPHLCALFEKDRPHDVNLNVGIAREPGTLPFFTVVDDPERSTFNRDLASQYEREGRRLERKDIPVEPLDAVLARHVPKGVHVDLLKVDAEGFERQVFESAALERWAPSVIVAEHNDFATWEPLLLAAGYELTLYEGLNRFYLHRAHPELRPALSMPPLPSMDGFAPWLYVRQLQEARARIREQDGQVRELVAQLADARRSLEQAQAKTLRGRLKRLGRGAVRLLT